MTQSRPVLMLSALDLELREVRAHLTGLRSAPHPAGTNFETGRLAGRAGEITIAATGQGNPRAAVIAERAIAMFTPQALLFVGVAGALKDEISLGDVVVATKIYAYHSGKESGDGFLARPVAWQAPHKLLELARKVYRDEPWTERIRPDPPNSTPLVHFAPLAAGEVLLNSRDAAIAERLRTMFNDAVAVEMESAGVALASELNGSLPVLVIRGISDHADHAKHANDEAGWQPRAAAHAAAFGVALAAALIAAGIGAPGGGLPAPPGGRQPARDGMPRDGTPRDAPPDAGTHLLTDIFGEGRRDTY